MTLFLVLTHQYFDAIVNGDKTEEYRLVTPYWTRRLWKRHYDSITLNRAYGSREITAGRLVLPWRGVYRRTITHPHFGDSPVEVFAIRLTDPLATT